MTPLFSLHFPGTWRDHNCKVERRCWQGWFFLRNYTAKEQPWVREDVRDPCMVWDIHFKEVFQSVVNQQFYIHFSKNRAWTQIDSDGSGTVAIFGFIRCYVIRRSPREQRGGGTGDVLHLDLEGSYLDTQMENSLSWTFWICAFQSMYYISKQIQKKYKIGVPGSCGRSREGRVNERK